MKTKFIVISLVVLALSGCATGFKSVKYGDSALSCSQLQAEFDEAQKIKRAEIHEKETDKNENMTQALSVAKGLVGIGGGGPDERIVGADIRMSHLAGLMAQKNCAARP